MRPKPSFPRLNRGHPLAQGLMLGAPLYEGSGTTANDLSGRGNNGTLNSTGVTWTGGQAGYCLSFAGGASDHVDVPAAMIGTLTTQATVACWFRPTSSLTAYQAIFDATTGGSGGRQLSAFLGGAANHLYFAAAGSVGDEATLSDSWVLNAWQHLTVTINGTTITIYRNGVQVFTGTTGSNGTNFVGSAFGAAAWQIGGNPSGGGAAFVGQQDSPLVYGRVLAAGEIAALYADSFAMYRPRPLVLKAGAAPPAGRQQSLSLIGCGA